MLFGVKQGYNVCLIAAPLASLQGSRKHQFRASVSLIAIGTRGLSNAISPAWTYPTQLVNTTKPQRDVLAKKTTFGSSSQQSAKRCVSPIPTQQVIQQSTENANVLMMPSGTLILSSALYSTARRFSSLLRNLLMNSRALARSILFGAKKLTSAFSIAQPLRTTHWVFTLQSHPINAHASIQPHGTCMLVSVSGSALKLQTQPEWKWWEDYNANAT